MLSEARDEPPGTHPSQLTWLPYVAPMALFLALTYIEGVFASAYVWLYLAKIVLVTAVLVMCRSSWRDIRPDSRLILPSVVLGIALCAVWIGVDKIVPYPHTGVRSAFNPFASIPDPTTRALFIAGR